MMELNQLDRNTLIGSLPHGGIVAEIGVDVGLFSEVIHERNKPQRLWLIDCWHHLPDSSDPANAVEEAQEGKYQEVLDRFADRAAVEVLRDWSVSAAAKFPDEYFDWWHIDADHRAVDKDIAAWWPKLKRGGFATGHDFCVVADYIDVKPKVEAFAAEHGLTIHVAGMQSEDVYQRNYPTWCIRKP